MNAHQLRRGEASRATPLQETARHRSDVTALEPSEPRMTDENREARIRAYFELFQAATDPITQRLALDRMSALIRGRSDATVRRMELLMGLRR